MVRGRFSRWGVPALAAAGIAVVSMAPGALATSAHPRLPAKTAAELLAGLEQSNVTALSGTIRTTANLGLPQLPDRIGNTGSGLQALLTGTHTLRLWVDGRDRQRLALLGDLAETDVVHSGTDLWTYTSSTNTVTHRTLPAAGRPQSSAGDSSTPEQQLTPQAQATKALKAIDPSTIVTVENTARVAGRSAYLLVLTPRTTDTLVKSVRIAVDAATSVPLRVQVFAAGVSAPVWQTTFKDVSFTTPAASIFHFTPPAGATIKTSAGKLTPKTGGDPSRSGAIGRGHGVTDAPTTVGTGWATILELPAGTLGSASAATTNGAGDGSGDPTASMLDRLTTAVPEGRLLTTRLLSAVITADGRVFLGAVPARLVEAAAAAAGA
jgi:outer membrane lipoprotein-sorting protein